MENFIGVSKGAATDSSRNRLPLSSATTFRQFIPAAACRVNARHIATFHLAESAVVKDRPVIKAIGTHADADQFLQPDVRLV